jgi:hypothetical protein
MGKGPATILSASSGGVLIAMPTFEWLMTDRLATDKSGDGVFL